ncbi:hypothetical protein MNEG_0646, partial [Monoraphidium neglectum]
DARGWSALHYAATCGDEVTAKILVDAGAAFDCASELEGWTPLAVAVGSGSTAVVQLLLNAGAQ